MRVPFVAFSKRSRNSVVIGGNAASQPLQFWSIPSPGMSGPPGRIVGSRSLQSVPANEPSRSRSRGRGSSANGGGTNPSSDARLAVGRGERVDEVVVDAVEAVAADDVLGGAVERADVVVAGARVEGVGIGAAVEPVVAGAAGQRVGAGAAGERVGAVVAGERVVAAGARDDVGARPAADLVVAG